MPFNNTWEGDAGADDVALESYIEAEEATGHKGRSHTEGGATRYLSTRFYKAWKRERSSANDLRHRWKRKQNVTLRGHQEALDGTIGQRVTRRGI